MTPVLSVANLEVNYRIGEAAISAVRDVSLTIASREALGIVGESGSGKTQTLWDFSGRARRRAAACVSRAASSWALRGKP